MFNPEGCRASQDQGSRHPLCCSAMYDFHSQDYLISIIDARTPDILPVCRNLGKCHKERHRTFRGLLRSLVFYWLRLSHMAALGSRNSGKCSLYIGQPQPWALWRKKGETTTSIPHFIERRRCCVCYRLNVWPFTGKNITTRGRLRWRSAFLCNKIFLFTEKHFQLQLTYHIISISHVQRSD